MKKNLITVALAAGLGLLAIWVLSGCISPGKEVATGLGQVNSYKWGAEGKFSAISQGSQEAEFTMAEGVILLHEDGSINHKSSVITNYLHSKPSADDAAGALAQAFKASVEQTKSTNELIGKMMGMLIPVFVPPAAQPAPAVESDPG